MKSLRISCQLFLYHTTGRPPCEVVNWKVYGIDQKRMQKGSTSLWGRELKDHGDPGSLCTAGSTSLWGRELKDGKGQKRRGRRIVDLLVRSWIESTIMKGAMADLVVDLLVRSWIERLSASSRSRQEPSRPPCEVVNWKHFAPGSPDTARSTSLWGRELKGQRHYSR